jgi:hypothetical protein
MAQLDKSNIVTGNTINASDVSALYDAFTAGGGYSVSVSGSLTGSATTALNASKLNPLADSTNNTRRVLFAGSSSADYEQVLKTNGNKLTYNPSTDLLNTTASYAVTASYALNGGGGGGGSTIVSSVSANAATTQGASGTWVPFGGVVALSGGTVSVDLQNIFPSIPVISLGLGRDIIVTANNMTSATAIQVAVNLGGPITIDFTGNGTDEVVFWGWVLQP